eukprot:scaffold4079_cov167-Amphora_coffeaeformis.AAC.6
MDGDGGRGGKIKIPVWKHNTATMRTEKTEKQPHVKTNSSVNHRTTSPTKVIAGLRTDVDGSHRLQQRTDDIFFPDTEQHEDEP